MSFLSVKRALPFSLSWVGQWIALFSCIPFKLKGEKKKDLPQDRGDFISFRLNPLSGVWLLAPTGCTILPMNYSSPLMSSHSWGQAHVGVNPSSNPLVRETCWHQDSFRRRLLCSSVPLCVGFGSAPLSEDAHLLFSEPSLR